MKIDKYKTFLGAVVELMLWKMKKYESFVCIITHKFEYFEFSMYFV